MKISKGDIVRFKDNSDLYFRVININESAGECKLKLIYGRPSLTSVIIQFVSHMNGDGLYNCDVSSLKRLTHDEIFMLSFESNNFKVYE